MNETTAISRSQHAYSRAATQFIGRKPQLFINTEWVWSARRA